MKDNTWEREDNVYSSSSISAFIEDYCRQSHCRKDSILYMNKKVLLYNTYDPDTKEFYNNPKNPGPVTSVVTENNRKRLRDSSDEESNELSNSTKEVIKKCDSRLHVYSCPYFSVEEAYVHF